MHGHMSKPGTHSVIEQAGQQELVPFRYDIEMESQTYGFYPDTLSDAKTNGSLQAAEIGAVYKGKFQVLPKDLINTVWEVQINNSTPAKIQPVKPKMWATRELVMSAGIIYQMK